MPKPDRPPTFRGSDFAMRYAQGQWAEERIIESLNSSEEFSAMPYGRAQVGPENKEDIPAYWAEYKRAESVGKRPDILVFRKTDFKEIESELPEDPTVAMDEELAPFLSKAICAVEAENSLWVAEKMPDYGNAKITRKNFIAPTVIVKEQDAPELVAWQDHYGIAVCVVQVFFDRAYIIRLNAILDSVKQIEEALHGYGTDMSGIVELDLKQRAKYVNQLQKDLGVFITEQSYADARTGTSTKKVTYRTHHTRATEFGILDSENPPVPLPKVMYEKNGKIMSYVHFEGGELRLIEEVKTFLESIVKLS